MEASLVLDCRNQLGEGPVWHHEQQQLYWVDFDGHRVLTYNPKTEQSTTLQTNQRVMVAIPTNKGHLLIAQECSLQIYDIQTGHVIQSKELDSELSDHRCNDGKCDSSGHLWIGTMHNQAIPGAGSLYRLGPDLKEHRMVQGCSIPNGLAWSADGRYLYHVDSPTRRVNCYDVTRAGDGLGEAVFSFETTQLEGLPDGMTIDAEGMLWIAQWGGACVGRWNPITGQLVQIIGVPAILTTSCTFGGKNLDTLFITSSRKYATAEELERYPLSGGLFAIKPGATGFSADFFVE